MNGVTLYRPVGRKEFELIRAGGFKRYPVLTEAYAIQIARDWNVKDTASGFAGYVTRFEVEEAFL